MGTLLLMGAGLQSIITGPNYDPDAQLFFNAQLAAGVILTPIQITAINTLVLDLKSASVWTKLKAVYPVVGGTATSHKFNLKDPRDLDVAFRLTFSGGWTHSSTGMLPNGTNAYASTFLAPSTSLTNNSTHLSYYSRTTASGNNQGSIGVSTNPASLPLFTLYGRSLGNIVLMDSYNYLNNRLGIVDTNGAAFYVNNRNSSTSFTANRNGAIIGTNIVANTYDITTCAFPITIGALNLNGSVLQFSFFESAFASIGDGLSNAEAASYYTAVQAYQTTLSRQV
jgi:hypothetical protein